ncbi:FUSC family protein [Chelatococcus reniformis]|uniref:Integral membrane bound transporter domain-containing protein n=1 Tax=Chelatococcus reniformis TaxID=1494448 RepID=A0A916XML2_9HYPH|nr:FUSC family protein [Chelatococcus reniformis]GGC84458.1 hypothetical protein GCM10010994_47970 [Chelatococcus reniformis]
MTWAPRHGLTTAAGVVLAVLLALTAELPDPWWAAISAWMVANPDRRAILPKSVLRIVGTLAGCALGYGLSMLLGGQPFLILVAIFICGSLGMRGRFTSPYAYAWVLFAITSMMMLLASLNQRDGLLEFAVARALEIVCGVIGALIAGLVLGVSGEGPAPAAAPPASGGDHDFDLDRVAAIGGLIGVVIAIVWDAMAMQSATQIAITSYVIIDRDLGTSRVRAQQRIGGCLLGAALGLLVVGFGPVSVLFWVWALGAGIFFFSSLHLGGGAHAYVGTQAGIAYIIALITGPGYPTDILSVVERLAGILIGVALAIALAYALAPKRRVQVEGR